MNNVPFSAACRPKVPASYLKLEKHSKNPKSKIELMDYHTVVTGLREYGQHFPVFRF